MNTRTRALVIVLVAAVFALSALTCTKKPGTGPQPPRTGARPARKPPGTRPLQGDPKKVVIALFKKLTNVKKGSSVHLGKMLKPYFATLPKGCAEHGKPTLIAYTDLDNEEEGDADPEEKTVAKTLPGFLVLITPHGYEECKTKVAFPPGCVVSVIRSKGGLKLNAESLKVDAHGKASFDWKSEEQGGCHFIEIAHEGDVDCSGKDHEDSEYEEEKKELKIYSYYQGKFREELEVTLKDSSSSDLSEQDETSELDWHTVGKRSILSVAGKRKSLTHNRQVTPNKTTGTISHTLDFYEVTAKCEMDNLNDSEVARLRKQSGGDDLPQKPEDGEVGD